MKFLVLALALVAVASALPANKPASDELHQIQQIVDAINSPSTDPATAVALNAMLQNLLFGGIAVGPAIIQPEPVPVIVLPRPPMPVVVAPEIVEGNEPISVGPALVDIVHGPADSVESSATPLVQIIVNIVAQTAADPSPVPVQPVLPAPIEVGDILLPMPVVDPISPILTPMPVVDPINIIDVMPVVNPISPILTPMPVVDPINIIDVMPVLNPISPILSPMPVVDPIQTLPAVNLPETLN